MLTQERLLKESPEHRAEVGCSDPDRGVIVGRDRENPPIGKVAVESMAYVIYVPSSTGEPRGVMVTRANMCDHVRAMQVPLEITADE